MRLNKVIMIVVVGLLLNVSVLGIDYYISPSGDDTAAGDITAPWRTITKALMSSGAGDTVYLRQGNYAESVEMRGDSGNRFGKTMGGDNGQWWTLTAFPGETPVISGTSPFGVYSVKYTRINGLTWNRDLYVGPADWICGIAGDCRPHHVEISRNIFDGSQPRYGFIEMMADDSVISDNTITVTGTGGATTDHGIYLHNGSRNIIRGNVISGVSGYGIHVYDERKRVDDPQTQFDNVVVEANRVTGSRQRSGIIVSAGGDTRVDSVLIRNNTTFGNVQAGLDLTNYGSQTMRGIDVGPSNRFPEGILIQNPSIECSIHDNVWGSGVRPSLPPGCVVARNISGDITAVPEPASSPTPDPAPTPDPSPTLAPEPVQVTGIFYVRQGASGNGIDWSNAFGTLPSVLQRGASYYIADGSYPRYTFDDAGGAVITIKKAIVGDHGTDTGWDDSYGNGQAVWPGWTFVTGNLLFDGQVGGGPSSWDAGHGFAVRNLSPHLINSSINFSDVTILHTELDGTSNANADRDAVYFIGGASNLTMRYVYVHDIGCDIWQLRGNITSFTLEYSKIARNSSGTCHGDVFEYGNGTASNWVHRWNWFDDVKGTYLWGAHSGTLDNAQIYGNVVSGGVMLNGIVSALSSGGTISNLKFYNNSIANVGGINAGPGTLRGANNVFQNNIWYASIRGIPDQTLTVDPFVSVATDDYRLRAAVPGMALAAPFDRDWNGDLRAGDGVWDNGALEFVGDGPPPVPEPDPSPTPDPEPTPDPAPAPDPVPTPDPAPAPDPTPPPPTSLTITVCDADLKCATVVIELK